MAVVIGGDEYRVSKGGCVGRKDKRGGRIIKDKRHTHKENWYKLAINNIGM